MVDILETLKNTSSTNEKINILTQHKDNELLKKFFYYTYSPLKIFGIKTIKPTKTGNKSIEELSEIIFDLFEKLSNRTYTGNRAREQVLLVANQLKELDQDYFIKALKKDLKIGVNAKLINKVWDGLIELVPYMGAQKFSKDKVRKLLNEYGSVIAETKYDGMFCNFLYDGKTFQTISRNGKKLYFDDVLKMPEQEVVVTGELLVAGVPRYKANGIIESYNTIKEKLVTGKSVTKDIDKFNANNAKYGITFEKMPEAIYMVVWDIIPLEHWKKGYYEMPYIYRREMLENFLKDVDTNLKLSDAVGLKTLEEIQEHFKKKLEEGEEGLVLKGPTAPWKDGKPKWCVKVKIEMDIDLKITGFLYGTPGTKYENVVNRIIAESADGKIKTEASGLKESEMKEITEKQDELLGKIVTITCSGVSVTTDGKIERLLHPRVKAIRTDKDEADTYEDILEAQKMAYDLTN